MKKIVHRPTGWEDVCIADLGEVVAGGTPSRSVPSYWDGEIPWVTPGEITRLRRKYVTQTAEGITAPGLAASAAKLLPVGSVLVTTRATLGETAIAAVPLATNQGFKNIIPNESTDSLFAFYQLASCRQYMESRASGTTFLEISKKDFEQIPLQRPHLDEQRRIAAVLDTLDAAIAKTEAVIAKLKCVRAGLLHDLLTRGLNADGQLRPPYDQAPQLYQNSPLGSVPREWHISTVGDVFPLQRGFDITVSQQRDGDVPVVSSSGISSYHDTAMVRGPGVVTGRKGKLGDIYFIEGDFWPHDTSLWVTSFSGNSERFCALLLKHMRLERLDAATSVPTLNRNNVHPVAIAVPHREEQDRIVQLVSQFGEDMASEVGLLEKMRLLKAGLVSDLLTGRVRVPNEVADFLAGNRGKEMN